MGAQQRVYRQRIRSTTSLKKIFSAHGADRHVAHRQGAAGGGGVHAVRRRDHPCGVGRGDVHSNLTHPLLTERSEVTRAAVLLVTADRGMAGAYSVNVLRRGRAARTSCSRAGRRAGARTSPAARAIAYYRFRRREVAQEWTGFSDAPDVRRRAGDRRRPGRRLPQGLRRGRRRRDPRRLHAVRQHGDPDARRCIRLLPLEVVEGVEEPAEDDVLPLYEFEPNAERVLDALLPQVHRQPDLQLHAAGRGLRAGRPPARDEVRVRQRPGPDPHCTPGWPTRPARPRSPRRSARSSAAPTRWPPRGCSRTEPRTRVRT